MIDITKLLDPADIKAHSIRYGNTCKGATHGVSIDRGPVVAWNITQRCNFKCKHCYSSAGQGRTDSELSTHAVFQVIDQFKELKVPVILLSGGEPFMRDDLLEIIAYIRSAGIRVSLSTNGSLITEAMARKVKALGVSYVGISLDGIGEVNDFFRGVEGAYDAAVKGIRNCRKVGQKVGLRMTIHRDNIHEVPKVLDFMEQEGVDRICFYHLVPSGRGEAIKEAILSKEQARRFMEDLMAYSQAQLALGVHKEILTVTNHVDGPYLYMLANQQDPALGQQVMERLLNNQGNRSGIAIMNMDWKGTVYPDQFSRFMPLGNVLMDSLETLWVEGSEDLRKLRNKRSFLTARCKACKWLDMCGGNLRARAYMMTGDLWGDDPGCYLEDDER